MWRNVNRPGYAGFLMAVTNTPCLVKSPRSQGYSIGRNECPYDPSPEISKFNY
jgi:hypothetical protein